jgi:hypothetical protein
MCPRKLASSDYNVTDPPGCQHRTSFGFVPIPRLQAGRTFFRLVIFRHGSFVIEVTMIHSIPRRCLLLALAVVIGPGCPCGSLFGQDSGPAEVQRLFQKAAEIDLETATIGDVIRLLGQPLKYQWENQTFTKDRLPEIYVARYPGNLLVLVLGQAVAELRFHRPGYKFRNAIEVGSTLDYVLKVLGPPAAVVEGQPNRFVDGVLYRDIDGAQGHHYYSSRKSGVRMFFMGGKVSALYLVRRSSIPKPSAPVSPTKASPSRTLKPFDDVRWVASLQHLQIDLRQLDLSGAADVLPTLTFNQQTAWPEKTRMPAGVRPEQLIEESKNPGLACVNYIGRASRARVSRWRSSISLCMTIIPNSPAGLQHTGTWDASRSAACMDQRSPACWPAKRLA